MQPDPSAPAKICPRCGAFYQDIRSQTCPQCFARLEELGQDTAKRLADEQAARIADPAFRETKSIADEHFKEQSFGACLAVSGILLATLVASVIFIWLAATRSHFRPGAAPRSANSPAAQTPPTMLFPRILGGFARRGIETAATLPGNHMPLYQGVYSGGIQVYAAPIANFAQSQQNELDLAATLAAEQHNPPLLVQEITTAKAQYAILGPSQQDVARVASAISIENTTP